jgi:acyl carrier protein
MGDEKMKQEKLLVILIDVINEVKKTGFSPENTSPDFYLGGDLGIDSVEMLEIWYDFEKALGISVSDSEKRDLYTLEDVIRVAQTKLGVATHSDAIVDFNYDDLVVPA